MIDVRVKSIMSHPYWPGPMPFLPNSLNMKLDEFLVYYDTELTFVFDIVNRDIMNGRLNWDDFTSFAFRFSSNHRPSDFKDRLRESLQENAASY